MAAIARDRTRRWEPFGVTEANFAAAPDRDGVRVVNVTPGAGGPGPGQAGWWLRGAAVALGVLAAAAAAVSWDAQYAMVRAAKPVPVVAALEAGIPDVGAVVFAALGVALALHGKRALRSRVLNAACIGISLGMNALAAGHGWRDLAIWVMPAAVYAGASDTLIGVVRAWVLARARRQGEALADDGLTPLAAAAGLALWLLRLSLAPRSTLTGFRSWVITDCPVAPGLRPGHLAELEAARQDADERIALAAREHDKALEEAAATARQARDEATRARAAETGIRAELDRARADASQLITQALADAAQECSDLRAWAEQQAERLQTELHQVREDLRAAHRLPRKSAWAPRESRPPGSRAGRTTKRDLMIELARQRRDLASVPLAEVSQLASSVAAEIGYSPGTARRELVRYVRGLQVASTENESTPDEEERQDDD